MNRKERDELARFQWVSSFSGLLLLVAWVAYLSLSLVAVRSDATFVRMLGPLSQSPARSIVFGSWVLLVVAHGATSAWIRTRMAREPSEHPIAHGVRAWLLITGVVAILGSYFHIRNIEHPRLLGVLTAEEVGTAVSALLSTSQGGIATVALLYQVTIFALSVHASLGLWLAVARGRALTSGGKKLLGWGTALLGLTIFLVGAHSVVYFATGWRAFGNKEPTPLATEPAVCPPPPTRASAP